MRIRGGNDRKSSYITVFAPVTAHTLSHAADGFGVRPCFKGIWHRLSDQMAGVMRSAAATSVAAPTQHGEGVSFISLFFSSK